MYLLSPVEFHFHFCLVVISSSSKLVNQNIKSKGHGGYILRKPTIFLQSILICFMSDKNAMYS